MTNYALSANIREGKLQQIPNFIQMGRKEGMCSLNDSLLELLAKDLVDAAGGVPQGGRQGRASEAHGRVAELPFAQGHTVDGRRFTPGRRTVERARQRKWESLTAVFVGCRPGRRVTRTGIDPGGVDKRTGFALVGAVCNRDWSRSKIAPTKIL
jgi:hypothetical protein